MVEERGSAANNGCPPSTPHSPALPPARQAAWMQPPPPAVSKEGKRDEHEATNAPEAPWLVVKNPHWKWGSPSLLVSLAGALASIVAASSTCSPSTAAAALLLAIRDSRSALRAASRGEVRHPGGVGQVRITTRRACASRLRRYAR